jgi:hypothetical protein
MPCELLTIFSAALINLGFNSDASATPPSP